MKFNYLPIYLITTQNQFFHLQQDKFYIHVPLFENYFFIFGITINSINNQLMKYLFTLLLITSFTTLSLAQKVKLKKGIVYIDAVAKHKIKTEHGTEVTISNLESDEEEIFSIYKSYRDPARVSKSNPEGKVRWIEITFLTLNKKLEIDSRGKKGLVKFLISNKIYVDGKVDEKAVDKLIMKYGSSRFSDERSGNVKVIINN